LAPALRAKGIASMDDLARRLIEARPDAFPRIQPRSLAVKLGQLDKGISTWWRSRGDQLTALEQLLDEDFGELIRNEAARSRGFWEFKSFPELPPVDLQTEAVPELGEAMSVEPHFTGTSGTSLDGWLSGISGSPSEPPSRLHPERGIWWLHVAPGCGRSLMVARFQARKVADTATGETIQDCLSHAPGTRPLVVAPEQAPAANDLDRLVGVASTRPVLIISSHGPDRDPAKRPQLLPTWHWLRAGGRDRRRLEMLGGQAGALFGSGERFEWRLRRDWRTLLLEWIETRLQGNSLFSAKGLNDWLELFDPWQAFFGTPEEVISLARLCHALGERKLPHASDPNAGGRLVRALGESDSRFVDQLSRLVHLRWADTRNSWKQALPWQEWRVACEVAGTEGEARPRAIDRGVRRAKRALTDKPAPAMVDLDRMVDLRLIVQDKLGYYGFRDVAKASLLLRDLLLDWMLSGQIEKWGAAVVGDPERQALADSVTFCLPPASLRPSVERTLGLPGWSAAALGASESLFLSIGAALGTGKLHFDAVLGRLAEMVVARSVPLAHANALPLSRSPDQHEGWRMRWIESCWGWSLRAPEPRDLPFFFDEVFPGWSNKDTPPDWLSALRFDAQIQDRRTLDRSLRSALEVAGRVVDRLGTRSVEASSAPEPLRACLLLANAARRSLPVDASWWRAIELHRWAQEHVVSSLPQDDTAGSPRLFAGMLRAIADGNSPIAWGLLVGPAWSGLLEKRWTAHDSEALAPSDYTRLSHWMRAVPAWLQELVRDHADPADPYVDWAAILESAGCNSDTLFDELLSGPNASNVAPVLWRTKGADCLRRLAVPGYRHASWLTAHSPASANAEIAKLLQANPELLPSREERVDWVVQRLHGAGGDASLLLGLLD